MPLPATTAAYCLQLFTARVMPEPLVLRLWCGPVPTKAGKYRECEGGGYRPISLDANRWEIKGEPPVAVYPRQTFVFQGPLDEPARGFCVTGAHSGAIRMQEKFDEEVKPEWAGQSVNIDLRLEWIKEGE